MIRLFAALFLMALSISALAQVTAVPPLMHFQGRLTKSDGTPVVNGSYAVRFSLWDAQNDGKEKWNQTIDPIKITNGTFAVLLSGFPADTFQSNLWLEIQIGTDTPLTPRQQLVSVAYAMKTDSIKDGGVTTNSLADSVVTAAKILDGTIGSADLASDTSSLNKVSGGNLVISNNRLFVTNGVIQQGGSPLTGTLDLGLYSQNSGYWMRFVTNDAPFKWYTDSGIGTTPRMTLTTGGNLGIGVVSPGTKLEVAGTAKMTGFQLTTGAGANRVLTSDASGNGTWQTFSVSGPAGGDLTGTYPNPTLANNTVNAAKLQSDAQSLARVSAGLLAASTAVENVDQQQTSANFGSGQTTGAQSFTPSVTGDLTALDIHVSSLGTQGATLRIYQGENLTGSGSPLLSQAITVHGGSGFKQFLLDSILHLTAGQTYTWLISSGASLTFSGSLGDIYPGGRSNADLNNDWAFRTYMGGRPNLQVAGVLTVSDYSVLQGSVGVGTSNVNGYKLFVNGAAGGTTTWNSLSDARYKTNVATFPNALDAILSLRGVTFDWKHNEFADRNFSDGRQIGFIAQEVEKVLPEIVTTDQNGVKSVAYANVVPVLVEAMKQQQAQIEAQQKQMDALKRRADCTDALAAENAVLKQQLAELSEIVRQIKAAQDALRASPLSR